MTDTEDDQPGRAPGGSASAADSGAASSSSGAPGNSAAADDKQRLLANRYRLESLLGRGSMGAVWKAHDVVLGRSVAVKEVLLPPTQTDEENDIARERALREARSIAALSHPNVVTLYDVVEDDGRPWVVMELVPAKNLAQILRDGGTLDPTEAARIGLAVLAALNSAHEVGITHRDVKPGNILVSPDGRVKLADFGISRRAEDSALTRTGLMVGSPSYIAPEVARGRAATSAADIWGLGATLQCAVEGTPPFDLGDPVSTLTAVVGDPPRPAPHAGPLQPLITRMLEKDPRDRIRPDEARQALEAIVAARPAPRPTYAPPSGPLAAPRSDGAAPRSNGGALRSSGGAPAGRPMTGPGHRAPAPVAGHGGRAAGAMRPGSPVPGAPGPAYGAASAQTGHAPRPQAPQPRYAQGASYAPGGYGAPGYAADGTQHAAQRGPATGSRRAQHAAAARRTGVHNPWIAALIGLLIAVVVGAGIILWISSNDSGSGSGSGPSSGQSAITPSLHPTANNTAIDGTTASGAIEVGGVFRPFSFELPEGWEAAEVAESLQNGRSEFIQSDAGTDPQEMVKVTVVAEPLTGDSVDAQIQAQMDQLGSPAKLAGYAEVSYEVTEQGSVLWQYASQLQGAERRGFLYATVRDEKIVWKVLTSGPSDSGQETADVANQVIKTFSA